VRFGFRVGELEAMDFAELAYWCAAVASYQRAAAGEEGSGE
jgi:hypothetical protein